MNFIRRRLTTGVQFHGNLRQRRRRTLFNVPGSDERKILNRQKLTADCIVLDLEDGVAPSRKSLARELVRKYLDEDSVFGSSERAARINAIGSGMEWDDLNFVLASKQLNAIVIPKVESKSHIEFVNQAIVKFAPNRVGEILLIPAIESAKAIVNVNEIAKAAPNIAALVFASEDYCADTGITRTESLLELLYARSAVVNASKACGIQAIDLVCIDYQNQNLLRNECLNGKFMGFTGKQAIHPGQIKTINEMFVPSEEEKIRAQKIVEAFKYHSSEKGAGAFEFEGKMIDMPMVKAAFKVIYAAGL